MRKSNKRLRSSCNPCMLTQLNQSMSCLHIYIYLSQNRQREEMEQERANKMKNKIFIYRWKVHDTNK